MFMFALLPEFAFVYERDTPAAYRPLDALFFLTALEGIEPLTTVTCLSTVKFREYLIRI